MGVLALFFASCGFEIPQRIQVNTAFDLHVPVGDIGEREEVSDFIKYAKPEKIASLFEDGNVSVCYYTKDDYVIPMPKTGEPNKNVEGMLDATNAINPGSGVRSMFLHFPLTSVNLDFTQYFKSDVEMPLVGMPNIDDIWTGTPSPSVGTDLPSAYEFPPLDIPLDGMGEWIEWIKLNGTAGKTTVVLKDGAALAGMLKMAVPAFGIGDSETDFKEGTTASGDLVFTAANDEKELKPMTDAPVKVYLQLTKVPPNGGPYKVEVDLKWTEAKVNPGENGLYKGTVPLPLGQFADFFKKYQIASLPCYLYVGGPFDTSNTMELKLKADNDWLVGTANAGEEITKDLNFLSLYGNLFSEDEYDGELHESSASFNLAAKLNEGSAHDMKLDYQLQMNDQEVTPSDTLSVISADMVVILPFQFEVKEDEITEINGEKSYAEITTMTDYGLDDNGDLFGRDQVEETTTAVLTSARILSKELKNTFFAGDLFLHVYEENIVDKLIKITAGESIDFEFTGSPQIPMPFHPVLALYAHVPTSPAVITINPRKDEDVFSVQLSADITGTAQYEQDF
jgi:hypothetical protein